MTKSSGPTGKPAVRKKILLAKVQIDRRTQTRAKKDPAHVERLAEVLAGGGEFDADVEVYDDGSVYWIGDGFHRVEAYLKAGRTFIPALVREGGWYDALVHAAGANARHGLPRTRADVRRSIVMLLELPQFAKAADSVIARRVQCDHKTVAAVRRDLGLDSGKRTYTDKHGNVTEMDVSGLKGRGKRHAPFSAPVNTFHDLHPRARSVLKDVLREVRDLPREHYSFVLAWLKGHLPPTPKEAGNLLTELEMEEEAAQPNGEQEELRS